MKINEFTPDTSIFEKIGAGISTNNAGSENDFGNLLKQKLDEVNSEQVNADEAVQDFIEGDRTDIHNVMLDAEQARMSLELAVQIRNKFVDAYQELNRTQM
ncbi:MAG: flagellar hook-basal body complex protein FliE [Clostridium sp.]|jgi:flagellar hook-basal body complex protein FliE|uniref:flagellar hook-basal body complex protein FliE n=1 Tax=Clostridium sp. TaxID=1506 RepID=UPI0025BF8300|nr:flagellar hook-basal body complex protein FliE [Clostridium sp.]MCH3964227.1 flagellar hook-basal body complex protein FliE [Clostridium sp.]MCI1715408.1 flagellar hook-basal body complex protein FliE [Clostridium sp.]MCI1799801.1 flagellar hook-basal body complex protein FliE [Clostridium sp.]MCI1813591.1 flagellar hook-basal body complex protein FliE [Clostridium sp.]MCI1870619.1 flagellar hook-basal body complex protein FliE [Clostridium sp.]